MMSGFIPYTGPKELHYLFVDGGSLLAKIKNVCDRYFGSATPEKSFPDLARAYTKTFYYDAVPVRGQGEPESDYNERTKEIRAVLGSAAKTDTVHVYEGDARRRARRGLEQKKVDVMLTVDMLMHTFRRNMHQATLLTGDGDFKPLIDALIQEGMFVWLWYPTNETSQELMQAADRRIPLDMVGLRNLLTPQSRLTFDLPSTNNMNPLMVPGELLKEWESFDGKQLGIYKDKGEFVITRFENEYNRLHIRHKDFELLKDFCFECVNIDIPYET